MASGPLTLEQTIKLIEKLERYHKRVFEREGGNSWRRPWEANKRILEMLRQPEPDATAIRHFIEECEPEKERGKFGGSGWYEVRMTIWRWEGADRGEKP